MFPGVPPEVAPSTEVCSFGGSGGWGGSSTHKAFRLSNRFLQVIWLIACGTQRRHYAPRETLVTWPWTLAEQAYHLYVQSTCACLSIAKVLPACQSVRCDSPFSQSVLCVCARRLALSSMLRKITRQLATCAEVQSFRQPQSQLGASFCPTSVF